MPIHCVTQSHLLGTFSLQTIPLRKTGYFTQQKRNTEVCKNLLDVGEKLDRNSYTMADSRTSLLFHFRLDLGMTWVQLFRSGFR